MSRSIVAALLVAVFSSGCGSKAFADISGSVDGIKLSAEASFWGGPFVVFTDKPFECMDMYWVKRGQNFETGVEAPVTEDMVALLFTYEASAVEAGDVVLGGTSPVDARLLVVKNEALTVYRADDGNIDVTEVSEDDGAIGSFTTVFDEGSLEGDFQVDWCTNLKSKY